MKTENTGSVCCAVTKKQQQQNIAFVSWDRNKTILFHHLSTFTFRKFLKVFDCLFSLHTAFHFRRNQLVQLDINYRFLQRGKQF